jgi:CRISPR-associated protein Cas1
MGHLAWLTETGRKAVLIAYQERKRDELTHPYLGEPVTLGLVPHIRSP